MVISHNLSAMNAQRQYNIVGKAKSKSAEKLSSGYKINRAADDAAGLTISEKMRWQIRGLNKTVSNIQDGMSLIQVTDGALSETESILQRTRELAVQAANDTNTAQDRAAIQAEINQNIKEFNRIAETTTFNGIHTLMADDPYAVDPTVSVSHTPTATGKGIYRMDDTDLKIKDASGNPKLTSGFQMTFKNQPTSQLEGKTFFLTCSQNCDQTFDFSFDSTKATGGTVGSPSSSIYININPNDVTNQKDIPAKIAEILQSADITGADSMFAQNGKKNGNYTIGHANSLYIDGSTMVFYPTYGSSNFGKGNYTKTIGSGSSQMTFTSLNMGTIYLNGVEDLVDIKKTSNQWELKIQAGDLEGQTINIPLVRMEAKKLGIDALDVSSSGNAGATISAVDSALDWVNDKRSMYGAMQNRLEHAQEVNSNTSLNTSSAESRLRDTDIAEEMVDMSKQNILSSVGESMIAQANHMLDNILSFLQ